MVQQRPAAAAAAAALWADRFTPRSKIIPTQISTPMLISLFRILGVTFWYVGFYLVLISFGRNFSIALKKVWYRLLTVME